MSNNYRSKVTYEGKIMAGARALWKATGVKDSDFGKPIIAVANSFTQFVPGHVHLHEIGQLVVQEIEKAGGILWYVGGWTSRCCGSGSGESIGEKRVDEEVLWLFIACFLIIEFEKISV